MEQKKEKIFVDGLNIQLPSEKAPDYILLRMGFNATKFFRWCQEHQDEKGWVNITVKKSTKGNIYGELDNWKPKKEVDEAYNQAESLESIAASVETQEIPF